VGLIPTSCVFCVKKCHKLRLRWRQAGAKDSHLIKTFLLLLNPFLCFLENIFTDGFITSAASGNRFSLVVLSYPPVEKIISTGT
jgi:hypothetical protein